MTTIARLEQGELDAAQELRKLLGATGGTGAVVSFVGTARPTTAAGQTMNVLTLEHHPRLTLTSLEQIASDAARRFDVEHVRVVHRSGDVSPGQAIVFAGAAALHRRAAFEAADYLMDRLKTEAVFWKREQSASGSQWIEPTEADYADRNRWE